MHCACRYGDANQDNAPELGVLSVQHVVLAAFKRSSIFRIKPVPALARLNPVYSLYCLKTASWWFEVQQVQVVHSFVSSWSPEASVQDALMKAIGMVGKQMPECRCRFVSPYCMHS